jgi:hypothetical protein
MVDEGVGGRVSDKYLGLEIMGYLGRELIEIGDRLCDNGND